MNSNEQNNGYPTVFAFFTGFMVGAMIGLLYAPSSGKEMREQVRKTSIDVKDQTVAFAQQTVDSIKESVQLLTDEDAEASVGEDDTIEDATEAT